MLRTTLRKLIWVITSADMRRALLTAFVVYGLADAQSVQYAISTAVGTGTRGFTGDGGPAALATLSFPSGVAFDSAGNLYVADSMNHRVRRITPGGSITTVAGGGDGGDGGPATSARLNRPMSVAVDSQGNLFIADYGNNRIRRVNRTGTISTVVGRGICDLFGRGGFDGDGGPGASAQVGCPTGVAVDASDNLYIADSNNHRIRRVTPGGTITTVAGSGSPDASGAFIGAFSGDGGPATSARLWFPSSVAVDIHGNLFIADSQNSRIRKVTPAGTISTIAGSGPINVGGGFSGDGGLAVSATLSGPREMALDSDGNLYFADSGNRRVRRIGADGRISTVAGTGSTGFGGDGGPANLARLSPMGVAIDATGDLFVADWENHRVRRLSTAPAIPVSGIVNAASGVGGAIAPGEFVSIFGSRLGPSSPVWSSSLSQGLGETRVFIGGVEAFTTYVSSNQVNAIVPYGVERIREAEVFVSFQGTASNRVVVPIARSLPGVFTLSGSGIGQAVAVNQDGTFNSSGNAADRGSIITFWATGQGQTFPAGIDGVQPQGPLFPIPLLPVTVKIGGMAVPSADVRFAGLVYAGVLQVNVRIPESVSPGAQVELLLQVGDATSLAGVTLPATAIAIK